MQSTNEMDSHWKIQYYQTCQELITYDFIGKFETLNEDFEKVCRIINIDRKKFTNTIQSHRTNATDKVDKFYTPELKKMIYEKYNIDFTFFDFEYKT